MQVPYNKSGKYTDDKVSKGCDSTTQICNVNDNVDIDAFARRLSHAVPKVVDGRALKDGDEKEDQSSHNVECHGGIENADMDAMYCDAE